MIIVMRMSTNEDIENTVLHNDWHHALGEATYYSWNEVSHMNLNIPGGSTIVVMAHGNGTEIGNAKAGTGVDINASTFLALIQSNMQNGTVPAAIYISTCGTGIAEFAANVRTNATQNKIWQNTRIFGHADKQGGSVQPPNSKNITWFEIF